ncbi:MAG: hypothetical protein QM820_53620 [Minicystis sp.]
MIVLPVSGSSNMRASVRVRVPEGALAEAAEALPAIDVSNLPGAAVPVKAGFHAAEATVRVVCATAPSRGWAPGIEEIVMGRVSQIARGALGGEVTRFEATETAAIATRFEQRFEARVQRGGEALAAVGRHVLGFTGEKRDAAVCSVVCLEKEGGGRCAGLVNAAQAEGAWVAAPPPSFLVRGILLTAERPAVAVGIVGAATIALAALVIARRPRPRG